VAETALLPATATAPKKESKSSSPATRRWLLFGTGLGIAVGARNLDWAVVRSRPSASRVVAAGTIHDFRNTPAAEWGVELLRLLDAAGEKHLTATLLLPRDEVIVRTLHLPGVADKDIPAAIELQADTLHPFGDEEIVWAWSKAGGDSVLLGLVRKALLTYYETLFSEAGVGLGAVSFSSAAIHAALRMRGAAPASFLSFVPSDRTEVYGESEARPVYSAELPLPPERALAFARAELRLAPDFPAQSLAETLAAPSAEGLSELSYTAALVASAPFVNRFANLLPKERRASNARRQYLLPLLLTIAAGLAALACFVVIPAVSQRRYLAALNDEIRVLEPSGLRAQALEKSAATNRTRIALIDDFRHRKQADLDVLNELTRILPPTVWTNSIEIYTDSVTIAGEADQASPLLKALDSSPLFQNSEFAVTVTRNGQNEQFRIKTMRRNRIGRTTP
jgi:Tfp pilus assembly protein PilN